MKRQRGVEADEWQYRERSSSEVRTTLLELTADFVRLAHVPWHRSHCAARFCHHVEAAAEGCRSPRECDAEPRDARHAKLGRRLKGSAQARLNSGADVFLSDASGQYLDRVCHYRECHPRVLCRARHCGAVPHLSDDLDVVSLSTDLIAAPPIELWPRVVARVVVPDDVEQLLLAALRQDERTPQ